MQIDEAIDVLGTSLSSQITSYYVVYRDGQFWYRSQLSTDRHVNFLRILILVTIELELRSASN